MAAAKKTEVIAIRPIEEKHVTIRVVGDSPLIMSKWTEKAKRIILEGQTGEGKGKQKDKKNPVEDFIHSMHWIEGEPEEMTEEAFNKAILNGARFGFPVTGFKQAAISAAYRLGWAKDKMSLRGVFFIDADFDELVEIHSDVPIMREDTVRIGMGKPDLRYRGEFRNWYADLNVRYNVNGQYSLENIVNIINAGGYACGVGEWRPERDGQFGCFHVDAC